MKLPKIPEFSKEILEEAGKLLPDDQFAELINKYNDRYLHWEELKHRKIPFDRLSHNHFEFYNWVISHEI